MKAVVDPTKQFESTVFGADDMLRIFPELRAGGAGVEIEQDDDDPDLYYIIGENGIHVNDCAFFSTEEMAHLIVTDDDGNIVTFGEDVHLDVAEIKGVIRRGSLVRDKSGHFGVVVQVNPWGREFKDLDDEHHGTLTVWYRDEFTGSRDNCEHFTLQNFSEFLTVLEY